MSELEKETLDLEAIIKTSSGLRDLLFDEIIDLRGGKTSIARARAVARLADKILVSVKYEIEWFALALGIKDLPDATIRQLPGMNFVDQKKGEDR